MRQVEGDLFETGHEVGTRADSRSLRVAGTFMF